MQYRSNKGFTGWGQLGLLMVFLGVGLVVGGLSQLIVLFKILPKGTSLDQMQTALLEAMKNPENIQTLRLMQIVGTFFILFVPAALFSLTCNGKNPLWLGFSKHINAIQVLLGFLIIIVANLTASPLEDLTKMIAGFFPHLDSYAKQLENQYNDQVDLLSHISGANDFIVSLFIMAFLPALFEEMFFRGALQNLFVKWWKQPLAAIIVTSFLFSLIHMSVYLFLSRALLGFALGMMFYQTKNIWVNIIAHFLNNAVAVVQLYFAQSKSEKVDLSKLDAHFDWWLVIPFTVLLIFLFRFLIRHSQKNKMKIYAVEQWLADNPEMWAK